MPVGLRSNGRTFMNTRLITDEPRRPSFGLWATIVLSEEISNKSLLQRRLASDCFFIHAWIVSVRSLGICASSCTMWLWRTLINKSRTLLASSIPSSDRPILSAKRRSSDMFYLYRKITHPQRRMRSRTSRFSLCWSTWVPWYPWWQCPASYPPERRVTPAVADQSGQ